VILAGGASTRFGEDKAVAVLDRRPMWEWVASALAPHCSEVEVAGRPGGIGGLPGLDDPNGLHQGPLSGLTAALAKGVAVLAVGVDQPWVRSATLAGLLERAGDLAVVPVDQGIRQTTCAWYPAGLAALAASELAGGGSIQSMLDVASFHPVTEAEWRAWGEDGRSWFSVDTPEGLEEGLDRFGPPGPAHPPM
jgi:molybdopterin-guanine dinucleotide biosynthesis protein A